MTAMVIAHNWDADGLLINLAQADSDSSFSHETPSHWPGEPRGAAEALFINGTDSLAGQDDWSGAHWNDVSKTLWLCRDGKEFRSYRRSGANWSALGRYRFDQDFEAITQADLSGDTVFLLAENDQEIQQYRIDGTAAELIQTWDIEDLVDDDNGMEGMAFVPDAALDDVFVDAKGQSYSHSRFQFGGIFLLSYQEGGDIYAVDLDADGGVHEIGIYNTPLSETRGLEFDRSTGLLHAIDKQDYATLQLTSTVGPENSRSFDIVRHTESPGPEGLEGIALPPAAAGEHWVILTDDENDADRAVVRYNQFDVDP